MRFDIPGLDAKINNILSPEETYIGNMFPYIGNFIIPTDELIFFRGVGIPPTR